MDSDESKKKPQKVSHPEFSFFYHFCAPFCRDQNSIVLIPLFRYTYTGILYLLSTGSIANGLIKRHARITFYKSWLEDDWQNRLILESRIGWIKSACQSKKIIFPTCVQLSIGWCTGLLISGFRCLLFRIILFAGRSDQTGEGTHPTKEDSSRKTMSSRLITVNSFCGH